MKTLRYTLLTLIFSVLAVALFAQGNMTIQGGGAVTVNGNSYIIPMVFTCGSPFVDSRDGQVYSTVQIGSQCWMKQNLNYGTMVLGTAEQTNNNIPEKYCYDNLESNCDVYGGLYQWDEAMQYTTVEGTQGICPADWHLPSDAEWSTLFAFLGGWEVAGGTMKEEGIIHWASPNIDATNSSGFTGLPGGYRHHDGSFLHITYLTYIWSSSEVSSDQASDTFLYHFYVFLMYSQDYKTFGRSVRCIKD